MQAFSLGERVKQNSHNFVSFSGHQNIQTTSFVSCLHVNMNILVIFLKSTETPKKIS